MKTPRMRVPTRQVLNKVHSLPGKKGMIAAIEPKSGEWFLGKTTLEAFDKAHKKHPDAYFYFVRVGYNATYSLGGTLRPI